MYVIKGHWLFNEDTLDVDSIKETGTSDVMKLRDKDY